MELLAEREVATLLRVDRATLRRWRERQTGPLFFRLGPKLIRYQQGDVLAWIESRRSQLAPAQTEV
jgi:predicted DNA-binding transcriptional regulator AlpA